jgi:hypothetical protein
MEAATARRSPARGAFSPHGGKKAPAARPAPRRKPGRHPRQSTGRVVRPAMAGAALLPQAAVRSVGAVRDFSDSGLIVRLTRGRGWIAVLCALLGGIVALNVISLSLNAGSGRVSMQIDELKTQTSALRAEIDERLSAGRVEAEASRLGLAVPDPKAITYLSANDGDAQRLARLLSTDGFLAAPSLPSSYPTEGTTYSTSSAPSAAETTTVAPPATTPTTASPTATAPSSGGGPSGSATGGGSSGSSSGATGGVGL